jgi:S1-C subfamily serine protease
MAQQSPPSSPSPSASSAAIVNPNTTQQNAAGLDLKKLAAATRPAVTLITVFDKDNKAFKGGTGFFVSHDGKLITNSHVIEGGTTATAKLENGATYAILGVLKPATDKDLLLLQVDAKDVPCLTIGKKTLPDVGSRVAVIGSPLGLEGTVSEGIISGHRLAKKEDEWLQMTAPVSPGSSGSPVVDQDGNVVGVATFIVDKAQALNFARPVEYVSQLLDQAKAAPEAEPAPLWSVVGDKKHVVLNDPDFIAAENALQKDDAAGALKILNTIEKKYADNELFLFKLGAVYDRLNLLDDAVQAYQRALKLQPTNGMGWTSLGFTLIKLQHFPDAKEAAKQAVKIAPDFGPAWSLLGLVYSQENRIAEASDAFEKASRLTPNDAEVWRSLSTSYAKLDKSGKSQAAAAKARALANASGSPAETAATSEIGKDSYTDLVKATLGGFDTNNIEAILSKYADKVVYRDYGVVDQNFIRADLEEYFARWPTTRTQLVGVVTVIDTAKTNEKRVQFTYHFRAASPDRKAFSVGSAATEWWVWETQNTLRVFGEKQKVTKRQKNH